MFPICHRLLNTPHSALLIPSPFTGPGAGLTEGVGRGICSRPGAAEPCGGRTNSNATARRQPLMRRRRQAFIVVPIHWEPDRALRASVHIAVRVRKPEAQRRQGLPGRLEHDLPSRPFTGTLLSGGRGSGKGVTPGMPLRSLPMPAVRRVQTPGPSWIGELPHVFLPTKKVRRLPGPERGGCRGL